MSVSRTNLLRTDLTARQEEDVALLDGKYRLLRIDTVEQLSGGQTIARRGLDHPRGRNPQVVARTPGHGGVPRAEGGGDGRDAAGQARPGRGHVGAAQSAAAARRRYPAGPLPCVVEDRLSGHGIRFRASQQVKWIDAHTAEVTAYAIRPGRHDGNSDAADDPPTDADKEPNNFIQSDDPKIVADARKVAPDETNPWRVALALERYVHKQITHKDLAQAFVTAAEVAATREGDCKAHAFYLAALARARGIPARVAVGLLYIPAAQAFAYHMWTEVYVQKRWIPIDGTLAKGGIGAGHLQLGHSNMAGVSAYGSFLPVIQVIGQLKLELLDTE